MQRLDLATLCDRQDLEGKYTISSEGRTPGQPVIEL